MIVDCEALITAALNDAPELQALGAHVVGATPDSTEAPWVKLTQVTARDSSKRLDWLITFTLQFDCYAGADGGKPEANDLARTVRALLRELPATGAPGGVVTEVEFISMPHLPDDDFSPARERYALTADITVHP